MIPRPDLVALPLEERLNIIEQPWDSLTVAEKDALPVPDWHREELQKRQADIDANADESIPCDELKRQLLSGK